MLNDHHGGTVPDQLLEHTQQGLYIQRMQADGGFIEHEHTVCLPLAHLAGKLQPLGFAAGKAGCLLAKGQVAKAQFFQYLQALAHKLAVRTGFQCSGHIHVHQVGHGGWFAVRRGQLHCRRFPAVTRTAHCARKGWRVLAATTTHIMQPPGGGWAQTDAELFRLWKCGSYAVAGTAAHGGKLTAPPQAQLERWMTLADIVLIEADGAKRMPCKAPAAHEPVLLPQCDTVLAVAGLSALRHPLREVCFRAELAAELLCVPQDAQLTPELLANLLASEAGGRKAVGDRSFYVVLNQADTKEQAALARQVADILKKIYRISCATSHFEKGERA